MYPFKLFGFLLGVSNLWMIYLFVIEVMDFSDTSVFDSR